MNPNIYPILRHIQPLVQNWSLEAKKDCTFPSTQGINFTRLGSPTVITYVTLTEKVGIYASIENDKVKLMSVNLENNNLEELNVADFSQNNPIVQIAVNPTNEQEITIATFENDIYQTEDRGANWKMIAEKGTLQE